jgi:hypothetical protein
VPTATPVTTPPLTLAIAGSLDDHVTGRLVMLPSESLTVAANVAVFETRTVADAGATVTLPTGA